MNDKSPLRMLFIASVLALAAVLGLTSELTTGRHQRDRLSAVMVREKPLVLPADVIDWELEIDGRLLQEALVRVAALKPRRWSHLVHALRFWEFSGTLGRTRWPGRLVWNTMSDAQRAYEATGSTPYVLTRHGVRFRGWLGHDGHSHGQLHRDQTLAALAEGHVPSTAPILVFGQRYTVADIVRGAAAEAQATQDAVEWTSIGLACYLAPTNRWSNKFGKSISFDQLCASLCRRQLGRGPCYGTHTLHALATLLAAHSEHDILSTGCARATVRKLRLALRALQSSQLKDGSWDASWSGLRQDSSKALRPLSYAIEKLTVTSHTLEWLALCRNQVACPRELPQRACRFLGSELVRLTESSCTKHGSVVYHAGTALRRWLPKRWVTAAPILRQAWEGINP